MKVGYLGPSGSFSEATANKLFGDKGCELVSYPSLDALQHALFTSEIDTMVMPFFNSKEGQLKSKATGKTYIECLIEASQANPALKIYAEAFVELNFCLLAKQPIALTEVKAVHVNPYGANLAKPFLSQYSYWAIHSHASSSAAAEALLHDDGHSVSLSSKQAAEQYGLVVLQENILAPEDVPIMQFLAVSSLESKDMAHYLPVTQPDIGVYLYQGNDIAAVMATFMPNNTLLNVYAVNGGAYYLELSPPLSDTVSQAYRPLGVFSKSKVRNCYQAQMHGECYLRWNAH